MKHLISFLAIFLYTVSVHADQAQILENYSKIPLTFTLNQGQVDSWVKFTAQSNGCSMFFTPHGTTYMLSRETKESQAKRAQKSLARESKSNSKYMLQRRNHDIEIEREYYALKLAFVNAHENSQLIGEEQLPWHNNYFIGNDPKKWQIGVPNYSKIRLKNLYDGIDLIYYGNNNRMKYDIVVEPGVDPSQILLSFDFGENIENTSLSVNENGELVISTPFGDIIERKPYCYQEINGKKVECEAWYKIIDRTSYSFELSNYNTSLPLVIDPELVYSTLLGGNDYERGSSISVDENGCVYTGGFTNSQNFPTTLGSFQEKNLENYDIFICKLNESGKSLEFATYLGGTGSDERGYIAVDKSGNIYVAGYTLSEDFPTTSGSYSTFMKGDNDVFVTKLNALGNEIIYSTYIGGSVGYYIGPNSVEDFRFGEGGSVEIVDGIFVDDSGNAYIIGDTSSHDFPTTPGAYDESFNLQGMFFTHDVFVTKLNSSGTDLVYSTLLGGNDDDYGFNIAVDNSGCAYVVGGTLSLNFPTTNDAFERLHKNECDCFVTKLNPSGSELIYSTFLGGNNYDLGWGIAVDDSGNAYITGETASRDFPTTPGAYNTQFLSRLDDASYVFVTKLNNLGDNLIYSTFIGGTDDYDAGYCIKVNENGCAYIAGETASRDFPRTIDAFDTTLNGGSDGFICKLNPLGTALLSSTYMGGSGEDWITGMALDIHEDVYITGTTESFDFPTTTGAYEENFKGNSDCFVAKLKYGNEEIPTITSIINSPSGVIQKDQNIIPQITVTNNSTVQEIIFTAIFRIQSYADTVSGITLLPKESKTISFSPWKPDKAAVYYSSCSLQLENGFTVHFNESHFTVYDVNRPSIIHTPSGVVQKDQNIIPQITVTNNSADEKVTYTAIFTIEPVYADTVCGIQLLPKESKTISFSSWKPDEAAAYFSSCVIQLENGFVVDETESLFTVDVSNGKEIVSFTCWACDEDGWLHHIIPRKVQKGGKIALSIGTRNLGGFTLIKDGNLFDDDYIERMEEYRIADYNNLILYIDTSYMEEGIWDIHFSDFTIYNGLEIFKTQFGILEEFTVKANSIWEMEVEVPLDLNDLFILLKKTTNTRYGHLEIMKKEDDNYVEITEGIGTFSEYHDLYIHYKNIRSGLYKILIRSNSPVEGLIKVCGELDILPLGEWKVGKIYSQNGSDWMQLDVPKNQTSLYFQTEGFGKYSVLHVFHEYLGNNKKHWKFTNCGEGYHIKGEIENPLPGRYYIEYIDSAFMYGTDDQTRDYMIIANTESIDAPAPISLSISNLSTFRGGRSESVSIDISGTGFHPEATVALVRDGYDDIVAQSAVIDSVGRNISATFDLSESESGEWKLKVTNPDGQNISTTNRFIIENNIAPEFWAEFVGRNQLRLGRLQNYIIKYGNSGNVDIEDYILELSLEKNIEVNVSTCNVYDSDGNLIADKDAINPLIIWIPRLNAGEERQFSIEIKVQEESYNKSTAYKETELSKILKLILIKAGDATLEALEKSLIATLKDVTLGEIPLDENITEAIVNRVLYHFKSEFPEIALTKAFETTVIELVKAGALPPNWTDIVDIVKTTIKWGDHFYRISKLILELHNQARIRSFDMEVVNSITPEDKYGPMGYDLQGTSITDLKRYVSQDKDFLYSIDFWNKEDATAPAQEVFIADTLSTHFNDATFAFTEFGFLKWTIPLEGGHYFNTEVDMRPDMNLIVNAEGIYDQYTREISWTFRSLDPSTRELPEDPMAGFLPPITESGYEIGWVEYTIKPLSNLPSGTEITNQAFVNFDGVGPWNPAPKEAPYLNTIDAEIPVSEIISATPKVEKTVYDIKWSGTDSSTGIANFTIYVSENKGTFRPWIINTQNTSALFTANENSEYRFYSIALDGAGNKEAPPDSFDIMIKASITSVSDNKPKTFALYQNYPNPFNLSTTIKFDVPYTSHIAIMIYNILGQKIRMLEEKIYEPGSHRIIWDGKDNDNNNVSNGIYLIKMQAGDFERVNKMLMLK